MFNIGYLNHKELTKVWGQGFVRINKLDKLDDSSNEGRYVGKYMEKAIGQESLESKGKKTFYSSRNLKKLQVTKLLVSYEVENIIDYDSSAIL